MTVLHIHNQSSNKGGTEVYLKNLLTYLPQYSVNSYWLALEDKNENFWITLQGEEGKPVSNNDVKAYLSNWINHHNVDLICIHNLFHSDIVEHLLSLRPVIKFSHSPVLVCPGRDKYWRFSQKPCTIPYGLHCFWHIYSQGCSNRHPKSVLHQWTYVGREISFAKSNYKKVIVMSDYNVDRLLECGVPREKIDMNPYFTEAISDEQIIDATTLPKKRLLFIGRIINGKGVPQMLEALDELLKSREDIVLDIIGNGIQMPEIKQLIEKKQLGKKVVLHGWLSREEIDQYLANCYLVIFPSTYPESFGIVGIEAMMYAKPVVAFDVGGVGTWLKHEHNGYMTAPDNTLQLGDYVSELINNREIYRSLSLRARRDALDKFVPQVHMQKLISTFKEAVI